MAEPPKAERSREVVHGLMGLAFAILVWTRFLSQDADPHSNDEAALNVFFFPIWAWAYWLAATTVPLRRNLIGVLAFGTALIGPLTSSPTGLAALIPIWWIRRSARIWSGVLEDDGIDPLAPAKRRQTKQRTEDDPPGLDGLAAALRESDPNALVPFLSAAGWIGADDSASEPLLAEFGDSLLVSLGWDSPTMVVIGDRSLLTRENKRTALANLRSRETRVDWLPTTVPSPKGETDVWVRLGDALTASDLWDPDFVRAARERTGAPVVFIAVPTRESMLMSIDPDPIARLAMARVEDPSHGEHVLGTELFLYDGGRMYPVKPMRQDEAGATVH